ncbi:MAG: hypothetical protein KIT83_01125 [Bryobacterales bacterium]|nr:hypothetical protein [Bryobacterales bacterium]
MKGYRAYLVGGLMALPMLMLIGLVAWNTLDPFTDRDCLLDCVTAQDLPSVISLTMPASPEELNGLLFTHLPGHRRQMQAIASVRRELVLDSYFPFVYPLAVAALILWAADPRDRLRWVLAVLALGAGATTCDLIENSGVARLLDDAAVGLLLEPGDTPLYARLKWGLLASMLALVAIAAMNRQPSKPSGADSLRVCLGFAGALLGFAGALFSYRGLFPFEVLAIGLLLLQGLHEVTFSILLKKGTA